MIPCRWFALALALFAAGCVTAPPRGLSIADVRDLKIVDVVVEAPKSGAAGASAVVWPKAGLAYAATQMPASSRPMVVERDPSGVSGTPSEEQRAWDQRLMTLSQSPAAQAHMHTTLAQVTRDSFRKRFVDQPAGKRPAKLKVIVKSLTAPGSEARFASDVIVLDGTTGRPLTEYRDLTGIRVASHAVVPATPAGILIGIAAIAIADQIRGDPAYEAIDNASASFAGWLMRE